MAHNAPTPGELEERLTRLHDDSFGWALSCCDWNDAEAEDVLQNSYVKVLSGQARYSGRSSFRTWLFGVVRLTALEQGRREASLRRRADGAAHETDVAVDPYGADGLVDDERSQILRRALDQLPERQRQVSHLVFYQGLTIAEAADVMGVSLGSARTHYHRGKERLKSLLTPEEIL